MPQTTPATRSEQQGQVCGSTATVCCTASTASAAPSPAVSGTCFGCRRCFVQPGRRGEYCCWGRAPGRSSVSSSDCLIRSKSWAWTTIQFTCAWRGNTLALHQRWHNFCMPMPEIMWPVTGALDLIWLSMICLVAAMVCPSVASDSTVPGCVSFNDV